LGQYEIISLDKVNATTQKGRKSEGSHKYTKKILNDETKGREMNLLFRCLLDKSGQ
jgi:hypothetical protein